MSIRVSSFTIELGSYQELQVARGEDRELRPTFTQSANPIDFTGALAIVLTVRSRTTGAVVISRSYSGFQGVAVAGTPRFQILQADTAAYEPGVYDCDITWTDASGYKTQLMAASLFTILKRIGEPGDSLTTPPAIPVTYGINWLAGWSTPTGGYQINDGVQAYDGSLGATAISTFRALTAGVTYYPIGPTQAVATGWAYIGQHGGAASTSTSTSASGVGNGVIDAGSLIKLSSSVAGRYEVLGAADSALLMVGVALTACAGAGSLFSVQLVPGTVTPMLSDGTGTIAIGAAVQPSATVAGRIKSGSTNLVGYNAGAAVTATLNAAVSVL